MCFKANKPFCLPVLSYARLLTFVVFFLLASITSANEFEDALFGESPGGSEDSVEAISSEENELFGTDTSTEADLFGENPSAANDSFKDMLSEKLGEKEEQFFIGGRYFHSVDVTGYDNQKTKETGFSSEGIADIYFDAALDDGVRFFLKQKIQHSFSEAETGASPVDFSGPEADTSIDQMWLKFDYQNKVYVTMGKQPTAWGSGFVWAPTDFVNEEQESPFSLSDQRLGVSLIKFQYPMDTQGINAYAVVQTNDAATIGEVRTMFRVEKVFEQSEIALSLSSKPNAELKGGIDFSTGLKWFDWYVNAGFIEHDQTVYYERPAGASELTSDDLLGLLQSGVNGDTTTIPDNARLITVDRGNEVIKQASTGLIYIDAYDDGSQLILNAEYFFNDAGYDDEDIMTLILLQDPDAFDPLYFSKRYIAGGFTRAGIGNASQSYGLQYIRSISDASGALVASFGFNPYRDLNFSSNLIVLTGGMGVFNPFAGDSDVLEETANRVANGELVIPEAVQNNLDQLPVALEPQDTTPITATVGENSFETPRYLIRTQLSLSF